MPECYQESTPLLCECALQLAAAEITKYDIREHTNPGSTVAPAPVKKEVIDVDAMEE